MEWWSDGVIAKFPILQYSNTPFKKGDLWLDIALIT
jgi:hypothetical protein